MVSQTLNGVDAGFALDITQVGCLTSVTVTQTNTDHPNATPAQQTGRYWTITAQPGGCVSGFTASLTLPTSFTPNGGAGVCRYTGSGTTWDCTLNALHILDGQPHHDHPVLRLGRSPTPGDR